MKKYFLNSLSLIFSFSTLICCGIPALLVFLGLGSFLASFISAFPYITVLSEYKSSLFLISFVLILIGVLYNKKSLCSIDEKEKCQENKSTSLKILYFSLALMCFGFLFSYILPNLL